MLNSRKVIKSLEKDGWYKVAQVGSHQQFKYPIKKGRVTVPHPKKDMSLRTIKSIEKQANLRIL